MKSVQSRRELLKRLLGISIAGGTAFSASGSASEKAPATGTLNIDHSLADNNIDMSGDPIRVGVIGFGSRGQHLSRVLGHATKEWLETNRQEPELIEAFQQQENLNVKLTAVCDVFDIRAAQATDSIPGCKRYANHEDLLNSGDVDAVIIATPDHWHAPMSIKALEADLHVYVEKPMTHNIAETYLLRRAVRQAGKAFQVGHQHRQTQSFATAQDIVRNKVLGHVSLVSASTNRNSPRGAWQYPIHEAASPRSIDWDQFLGNAPPVAFNKEHFFRWRKWWAYGSGLTGDLMTHDFDRVNCVLDMGIPASVSASGGVYTNNDGRNTPDVLHVCMEYPDFSTGSSRPSGIEKGMTIMYSATLGNQRSRPTLLMGHDATLELGNRLVVTADPESTQYRDRISSGEIDPLVPIYIFDPSTGQVDLVSSASVQYFADRGLLWAYQGGKLVDSAYLHVKEWLGAIRNGTDLSCGIDEGFEEAITAHMASLSWKLGRQIHWDSANERIVEVPGVDFDSVLLRGGAGFETEKL